MNGHAPPPARRAEASALAREGDHAVESALVAVHAHEAVGEDAAAEESPKLALDEAGYRALTGLCPGEEDLELPLDHAVEDALLRSAAGVGLASIATVSVDRPRGSGCKGGHAARPLPGPYRGRRAPGALASVNRTKIESARSRLDRLRVFTARCRRFAFSVLAAAVRRSSEHAIGSDCRDRGGTGTIRQNANRINRLARIQYRLSCRSPALLWASIRRALEPPKRPALQQDKRGPLSR